MVISGSALSDEERTVLKALRNNKIDEIHIRYNDDKTRTTIRLIEKGIVNAESVAEVKRTLGLKNYEEISIESRDNKTLTFQKTKR